MKLVHRQNLAFFLDKDDVYKLFASHYRMNNREIQQLERTIVSPKRFNPTEELFRKIRSYSPKLSLDVIIGGLSGNVAEKEGMEAVVKILETIKQEIIKNRRKEQRPQQGMCPMDALQSAHDVRKTLYGRRFNVLTLFERP